MENLDLNTKKPELLTDEELKEVTGGSQCLPMSSGDPCAKYVMPRDCMKVKECTWTGAKCITKSKS